MDAEKQKLLDEVERLNTLVSCMADLHGAKTNQLSERGNTLEARATRAEAHAERLAGALEETLAAVESHRRNVLGATQSEYAASDDRLLVARSEARSALSSYRGVKDEACSRPSDALDAPVADQSTTCSQPEGAEQ